MSNNKQNIEMEKNWYHTRSSRKNFIAKLMYHPLILNKKRLEISYDYAKKGISDSLSDLFNSEKVEKLLIAPCGNGVDYEYVKNYSHKVYGIDLSEVAVESCDKEMIVNVADILESGYEDDFFDVIVSPLFFHHLRKIGFNDFLLEFKRILKKGGVLVILEPSCWYPLNIITRPLKLLNNPYQEVDDEGPIPPGELINSLKAVGFESISVRAATFTHSALPLPLSRLIHRITKPILSASPLNRLAWMVVYSAKKRT